MTAFLSDNEVIERVLEHSREGTTDEGSDVWREPVENYRSEARFAQELALLRQLPVPFCPSAALRQPGDYVAREAAGVPLVAVRGADGTVRAFRNACRHRGAEVANGSGNAKAFTCPFHGWTYKLDGGLAGIPHERGFPGLEREAHGLVPVHVEEKSGIVFITQDQSSKTREPLDDLPNLIGNDLDLIDSHDNEADFNWKISLEGSIEGYHIRFGHPETFYPYGYDNLNLVEFAGRHSRVTFPFRRIEKQADVPESERTVDGRVTYVYHLFPNALVTVLSRHTILVVLEPLAPGRTRNVAYSLAYTGGDPALAETAKRDAQFVTETGAPEDRALAESVQRAMKSGANEYYTFGHFESALVHFHRNLDSLIDD